MGGTAEYIRPIKDGKLICAQLAQLVEHPAVNRQVVGPSPTSGAILIITSPLGFVFLFKESDIMSKFTSDMVDKYADKVLIGLTEEENKMVVDEMDMIDETINLINNIPNISEVEPMTHCLDDFIYELRCDEVEESIPTDVALENCDDVFGDEIRVPKVVG